MGVTSAKDARLLTHNARANTKGVTEAINRMLEAIESAANAGHDFVQNTHRGWNISEDSRRLAYDALRNRGFEVAETPDPGSRGRTITYTVKW